MRISFSFVMRDLCLQREVCVFGGCVWEAGKIVR
jgi:hypothetical protein